MGLKWTLVHHKILNITTRTSWHRNPNQGCSSFSYNIWSLYEYLIHYRSEGSLCYYLIYNSPQFCWLFSVSFILRSTFGHTRPFKKINQIIIGFYLKWWVPLKCIPLSYNPEMIIGCVNWLGQPSLPTLFKLIKKHSHHWCLLWWRAGAKNWHVFSCTK